MRNLLTNSRKQLACWTGWFFIANVVLFCLIGISYLPDLPHFALNPLLTWGGQALTWVFIFLAMIGQFSLFAFGAAFIVLIALVVFPQRHFIIPFSVLLASLIAAFLVIDSALYHLYQFHLAGMMWHMLSSGAALQVLDMSWLEWLIALIMLVVLLFVEAGLALQIYRWLNKNRSRIHSGKIISCLLICLFASYGIYFTVAFYARRRLPDAAIQAHVLQSVSQIVPYYAKPLHWILPRKLNAAILDSGNRYLLFLNRKANKALHYPLKPLQFTKVRKHLNVVVIAIDTWRFDMMNPVVTPHIATFAKKSWQFADNYSGGNSTRPGVFSLFYSIPATYWSAALQQKHGPVFISALIKAHYKLGVFVSASLKYPDFVDTVFRDVKDLPSDTVGATPVQRDRNITQEFSQFVNKHKNKPFFSFVFYDEAHDWCGSNQPYAKPFQPAIKECDRMILDNDTKPTPYLNRYKNALHFVDGLIGKDLQTLRQQGLLKNTVVIITSDHGEEFNDEHLGYWGHASSFDPYQTRTPLIIYWPGQKPKTFNYKTSHYDIVPTLMEKVLGSTSPAKNYSVGVSLLSPQQRPYIIVSSYNNYAIVSDKRITTIYPGGDYTVDNKNGKLMQKARLDHRVLRRVFKELNRYYQ